MFWYTWAKKLLDNSLVFVKASAYSLNATFPARGFKRSSKASSSAFFAILSNLLFVKGFPVSFALILAFSNASNLASCCLTIWAALSASSIGFNLARGSVNFPKAVP